MAYSPTDKNRRKKLAGSLSEHAVLKQLTILHLLRPVTCGSNDGDDGDDDDDDDGDIDDGDIDDGGDVVDDVDSYNTDGIEASWLSA